MAIDGGGSAGGTTTLTGLTDTPAGYGANGQVLTSNGVDAATWATPSAAYALSPADWASLAGVEGVGKATALAAASYPDISVTEGGGQALASGPTELSGGGLRIAPAASTAAYSGLDLGTIAADADGVVAVRFSVRALGLAYNASVEWEAGLYIVAGTNSAANNICGVGYGRLGTFPSTLMAYNQTTAVGRAAIGSPAYPTYSAIGPATQLDVAIKKVGAGGDVYTATRRMGDWEQFATHSAFANDAGGSLECRVMLLCRSVTAGLTLSVDVHEIGKPGVFTDWPQVS